MANKLWMKFDLVALIAWLDFSLWKGINFEKTVIEQLKESRRRHTGHAFEFTLLQVRNKLIDLGRKDTELRDDMPYPRLQEIFSRGSVCFPGLASELRQLVDEAIRLLQTSSTPLQLEMATQLDQTLGEQNLPKAGLPEDNAFCDGMALEVQAKVGTHPKMASKSAQSPAIQRRASGRTLAPIEQPYPEASTNSTPPTHPRKKIDIRKGYSPHDGAWQLSQALETDNEEARELKNLREAEIATLYGRIADLEKDNESLWAMLKISQNSRKMCESAGKDPKESQFRLYQEQLYDLQQRNKRLENTAEFFKLDPSESRSLRIEDIDNSMDQIRSVLESILGDCDTTNLQLNTTIEPGSDLEVLLLSSLDLHKTPEHLKSHLKEYISQIEAPVILRTLVLAALQDWVFNTSFPSFMTEGATSLLLKSMEEIIMDHRDWALLRNLETAAYSRLLERSEFKEGLLPWTSRLLAERLKNVTATFLTQVSLEDDPFDEREALNLILKSLHCRFVQLFTAGLQFKAVTGATDNRYEFVVNALETFIVENDPEPASRRTSEMDARTQKGHSNTSWFHASLRVYGAAPPNRLNPRADAIIQTNNFVPGLSKTKCHCIYISDIAIEKTETSLGRSNLQIRSPFSTTITSQRELFPLVTSTDQPSDAGFNNFREIGNTSQQKFTSSIRAACATSTADRAGQIRAESFLGKQIPQTEARLNEDNGSLSDKGPLEPAFEVEAVLVQAEGETSRSETSAVDRGADSKSKNEGPWICHTCGTPLSSNDSLRRHERNGSCCRCALCERVFRSNSALKKHQRNDHPTKKRMRPSEDDSSTKRVNLEKREANEKNCCEKCGYEPTSSANLQTHKTNKSCSKCFKSSEELDGPTEFHSHMKISHGLQMKENRWRRLDLEKHVDQQHVPSTLSTAGTSGHTEAASKKYTSSGEREVLETRILPPSTSKHAKTNATSEKDLNSENTQVAAISQNSPTQTPTKSQEYCFICEQSLKTPSGLEKHQQRKCHRRRVRELKKESARQRQSSVPQQRKNHTTKSAAVDGTSKSRVEKPRSSRASTEMRREPTPESRHVARIIAELAKIDQNPPIASSQLVNQQEARSITPSVSQNRSSVESARADSTSDTTTTEQMQVVIAPANFGKPFSAPSRTFENVRMGTPSSSTDPPV